MKKVIELQEQAQNRILEVLSNSGVEIDKMYLENDYTFDHLLKFDIPKEFLKDALSKDKYTIEDEDLDGYDERERELLVSEEDLDFIANNFKLVIHVENFGLIACSDDIGNIYLMLSTFDFEPVDLWIDEHVEILNRLNKYNEPKLDKLKQLLEIKKDSCLITIPIGIPQVRKDGIWIEEIQEFLSEKYKYEFDDYLTDGLTDVLEKAIKYREIQNYVNTVDDEIRNITIKELSRVDLGIPCKWEISNCPYYENEKLECSSEFGVRCNGKRFEVTYSIDNEIYKVIENQQFSKPLDTEIEVNVSKNYLLNSFKQGHTLNYLLRFELN